MTKICTKCGEEKPIGEFAKCAANLDGFQYRCKICHNAACEVSRQKNLDKSRARKRKYYVDNQEKLKAQSKQYRLDNPEWFASMEAKRDKAAEARRWKKENPEEAQDKLRHDSLMRKFRNRGLTLDQYHSIAERQDFLCAVCGEEPQPREQTVEDFDNFVIDHNHATGKVRGLTCWNCNVALGMLRDNPEVARKAATYLERHI